MTLPETIVARLLNEEHFDVHQHPELYLPANKTGSDGKPIVRVCSMCEKEFGADRVYPQDVELSHSMCRRHIKQQWVDYMGLTPEQAEAKVSQDCPPDWQEALGEPAGVAAPPKATFWATSGGLD